MASTNKCLAQSNKPRTVGNATKKDVISAHLVMVGARGIRVVMSTHDLSKARRLVVDIVSIPPRRLQILACTRTRFWLAVEYRLADPNSVDWPSNINCLGSCGFSKIGGRKRVARELSGIASLG